MIRPKDILTSMTKFKQMKLQTDVLKSRVASAPLTAPEATIQESIPSNLETAGLTKDLLEFVECQRQYISTVSQEQVQGLPMKEYLEVTLLPVLLEGMKAVVRERYGRI